ncbi:hypothetical protein [Micromonospora sp. URMC 103]|uniref:hypothetical protein n=1 Tax=Micromonospora sp. URMC 103 TaxID=3423406 RepID=UPI003F1BE7AB
MLAAGRFDRLGLIDVAVSTGARHRAFREVELISVVSCGLDRHHVAEVAVSGASGYRQIGATVWIKGAGVDIPPAPRNRRTIAAPADGRADRPPADRTAGTVTTRSG